MEINLSVDVKKALAMLSDVKNNIVERAAASALNKTLTTVTAIAAREIKKDMGSIKISEIKQQLKKKLATVKDLHAAITASGQRLFVMKLDPRARQNKTGVTWNSGAPGIKFIPGAFIATMKNGHRGVFKRKGQSRLPIQELHGASLPKVFANKSILDALESVAREKWSITFTHELNYLLSKYK